MASKSIHAKTSKQTNKQNVAYEKFLICANTYFPKPVHYGIKYIEHYIANAEDMGELRLCHHDYLLGTGHDETSI